MYNNEFFRDLENEKVFNFVMYFLTTDLTGGLQNFSPINFNSS